MGPIAEFRCLPAGFLPEFAYEERVRGHVREAREELRQFGNIDSSGAEEILARLARAADLIMSQSQVQRTVTTLAEVFRQKRSLKQDEIHDVISRAWRGV